jgi:adenylate kinase
MVIVFLGPPGSGKGTQSRVLSDKLGLRHISTGDLIRAEIASGSDLSVRLKTVLDSGALLSDDLMMDLLKPAFMEATASSKGCILDGFPRTLAQANLLDALLEDMSLEVSKVFNLSVQAEDLVNRLSGRYTCANCGAIYNDTTSSDCIPCKECGSLNFLRRADDQPDVIRNRLLAYTNSFFPLLEFYEKNVKLVTIDGSLAPDDISEAIEKNLP